MTLTKTILRGENMKNLDVIFKSTCLDKKEYKEQVEQFENLNKFFESRGIKNKWIKNNKNDENIKSEEYWYFVELTKTGNIKNILNIFIFDVIDSTI